MIGIRMSMSTTSGCAARDDVERPRAPSPASPTTSRSACESMTMRMPARNSAWSSTRATRIAAAHGRLLGGGASEAAARRAASGDDEPVAVGARRVSHPPTSEARSRHADEAVPGADGGSMRPVASAQRVAHLERRRRSACQRARTSTAAAVGVPEGVRERLLHDAVDRELHAQQAASRRRHRVDVDAQVDAGRTQLRVAAGRGRRASAAGRRPGCGAAGRAAAARRRAPRGRSRRSCASASSRPRGRSPPRSARRRPARRRRRASARRRRACRARCGCAPARPRPPRRSPPPGSRAPGCRCARARRSSRRGPARTAPRGPPRWRPTRSDPRGTILP